MDTRLDMIWNTPKDRLLSAEDIAYLKSKFPKSDWRAKYAFHNKYSKNNTYIVFIIDAIPYAVRRSAVENNWDIVCERPLTALEYEEALQNFGCHTRRFRVWHYQRIEQLQIDDLKYNLYTPKAFVKAAQEKGYTGAVQLSLDLERWIDEKKLDALQHPLYNYTHQT